jgi:hypothetical protein
MMSSNKRWMMIVGVAFASALPSVGCSSNSSSPNDSGNGTGGGNGGAGSGGHGAGGSGTDASVVHAFLHTFDTNPTSPVGVDGFVFNTGYGYSGTGETNLAPLPVVAGDASSGAGGADGGTTFARPTITWDGTVGDPAPGSLKITATFTACNQFVEPAIVLSPTADLTGKKVSARLQVTSGMFSGGAQLYLQTDANYGGYAKAAFTIPPTGFATAIIDLATAISDTSVPLSPGQVIHVGVKIFSGYAPTCTTYANPGVAVVFNLDTFTD